jgi:predicted nicotinamide N-methyase
VQLVVPDQDAIKDRYQREVAAGSSPQFPYWSRIWPSAVAMALHLEENLQLVRNMKVLELAAGLGLPSVFAARYASEIVCSDYNEEATDVIRMSAELNGLADLHTAVIDWNCLPFDYDPDLVLLSDVNYEPASFPALSSLVLHFLERSKTIVLTTPQRLMAKTFIETVSRWCVHQSEILVKDTNGIITPISVMELGAG